MQKRKFCISNYWLKKCQKLGEKRPEKAWPTFGKKLGQNPEKVGQNFQKWPTFGKNLNLAQKNWAKSPLFFKKWSTKKHGFMRV